MSRSGQQGRRWLLLAAASVLCAGLNAGCGYSLAGRGTFLPSYIKTIGVPNFTNRTTVFNLESQLTQKVRSEFIGRGKYQIVPEGTGVDAVLIGEILSARVDTASVNPTSQLALTQSVTVTAKVELRDVRQNTVIWQNASLSLREDYAAQSGRNVTDPNAFFAQDANALERLTADFAHTIVTSILEAF
jgi:hypothetical protein